MEVIFLAGLSIPALTLALVMAAFLQSMNQNFLFKKTKKGFLIPGKNAKVSRQNNSTLDSKHVDFSGGLLGI